jgi:hypothetical protein
MSSQGPGLVETMDGATLYIGVMYMSHGFNESNEALLGVSWCFLHDIQGLHSTTVLSVATVRVSAVVCPGQ